MHTCFSEHGRAAESRRPRRESFLSVCVIIYLVRRSVPFGADRRHLTSRMQGSFALQYKPFVGKPRESCLFLRDGVAFNAELYSVYCSEGGETDAENQGHLRARARGQPLVRAAEFRRHVQLELRPRTHRDDGPLSQGRRDAVGRERASRLEPGARRRQSRTVARRDAADQRHGSVREDVAQGEGQCAQALSGLAAFAVHAGRTGRADLHREDRDAGAGHWTRSSMPRRR